MTKAIGYAAAMRSENGRSMSAEPSPTVRIVRGAVAGLVAGMVASFAMDRFQALAAKLSSSDDKGEPATAQAGDALKQAVTGTPVAKANQPLAGQMVHYAVGAGLGIAYGIAAEFRPQVATGYGTLFALGTTALLDEAAVPAAGFGPPPWETDPGTHAYSVASHLVFGAVAEFTRRQVATTFAPD